MVSSPGDSHGEASVEIAVLSLLRQAVVKFLARTASGDGIVTPQFTVMFVLPADGEVLPKSDCQPACFNGARFLQLGFLWDNEPA